MRSVLQISPKALKNRVFDFWVNPRYAHWQIFLSQKRLPAPDENVYGLTNWSQHCIFINVCRGSLSTLPDTIIHEIIHILLGYNWHIAKQEKTIERIVRKLTAQVLEVLSPLETWALLRSFIERAWWDE